MDTGKNLKILREKDLRFEQKCTNCGKLHYVLQRQTTYKFLSCECGKLFEPKSTGRIAIVGCNSSILDEINLVGRTYIEQNVRDVDLDVNRLEIHDGRFIWACRKHGGSDLLLLDLPYKRHEYEGDRVFGCLQNERFFYYGTYFREVNRKEAAIIWRAEYED